MTSNGSTTAKLRIGIIGPRDSVEKILKATEQQYPEVTITPYIREKVVETVDIFDLCNSENDGFFFTGVGVMEEIRKNRNMTKPYEFIPRSGYSLMSAIWEMTQKNLPSGRISVDVVPDQVIREVMEEFNIEFDEIFTMPFSLEHPESSYTDRHRSLFNDGKIDIILTGFGSVYTQLSGEGLPVLRLYPSLIQIRQQLDKLIYRIRSRSIRSAGIALQIIRVRGLTHNSLCKYDDLEKRGRFYLELMPYVRGVQGSLFAYGREEMIIHSTRGEIEREENRRLFHELIRWSDSARLQFYSGIGFGSTAYEAEKSARKALANAQELEFSSAYIVDDDQIKGPIAESRELEYLIRVDDPVILEQSERSGINAAYLTKIKAYMDKSGKDTFDSTELSYALNIGERTARRVLKKALDSGLGEVTAKESSSSRGRPKNLIRLKIF